MSPPPTATIVRLAGARDASGCRAIYAPIVERTIISFEESAPSVEEMAARISATVERYPWLVAEREGTVVGYAYAGEHRSRAGYRWSTDVSVYFDESARGRGLATVLYRALFAILAYQGFHRAHAGITLPNDASVALHRSAGFAQVGVYPEVGFKDGRWLDVSWWTRELAAPATPPAQPIPMASIDAHTLQRFGVVR